MSQYSIKDIELLSGIKAHTLRMWEQRYNVICPKRTKSNIRYYDDEDLKLVLNISLLRENGYKISKICNMPIKGIQEEVWLLIDNKSDFPEQLHGLTLSMLDMDEDKFEEIMNTTILQIGFERTMINLIFPFFHKIGILWQTGAVMPVQEHFISNLVRQKLIVAIDGQLTNSVDFKKKYVLFLPEEELHELGLLFSAYLIRSRNNKVIYLGQSVPEENLVNVCNNHKPDYLMTVMTTFPSQDKTQTYINDLSSRFVNTPILISGTRVLDRAIDLPNNLTLLGSFQELNSVIDTKTNSK